MNLNNLIKSNRSFRRFDQEVKIDRDQLLNFIELARLSASATNKQPLKFLVVDNDSGCSRVFPSLGWAGYLTDWDGPAEGEQPSAYIIILGDRSIATNYWVDHGIAAQSILLGATEAGFGGCMIASIDREKLGEEISLPENLEILLVLALGKPGEKVVIDQVSNDDIKYWRDKNGIHHVPKRDIKDLVLFMQE